MNINARFNLRTVKSFVLRQGRLTARQALALQELWPKYGVDCQPDKKFDLAAIFPRPAPVILEIGFGNGKTLLQMAKQYPEFNFLGIEVYKTGIARLFMDMHMGSITNLRVINGDAVDILRNYFPDARAHIVQLFFPDPWPKTRHHKRRIVRTDFVNLVASKLVENGIFHIATDWADYARQVLEILEVNTKFVRLDNAMTTIPTLSRGITKFERRGLQLGHNIYEFVFQRR